MAVNFRSPVVGVVVYYPVLDINAFLRDKETSKNFGGEGFGPSGTCFAATKSLVSLIG